MREIIIKLVREIDDKDLPDLLWIVQQYARRKRKREPQGAAD